MQEAMLAPGGETEMAAPRPARRAVTLPAGLARMLRDGALVMAVADALPMPASWHFRLAFGLSLALLSAGLGSANGGYGELAASGRRGAERSIGQFLAALLLLRLVAGLLDRGALISPACRRAGALAWFGGTPVPGPAPWPAGLPAIGAARRGVGADGAIVIQGGAVAERDIEAAIRARGIQGGVAGVFRPDGLPAGGLPAGGLQAGGLPAGGRWPLIHQAYLRAILQTGRVRDVVFVGQPNLFAQGDGPYAALFRDVFGLPARLWLALDWQDAFPGKVHGQALRYRLVPMLGDDTLDAGEPWKRLFDILVGGLLLLALAPLLAGIALALRLSGTRRVLFRQSRTGAGGRPFTLLKFRTMNAPDDAAFAQAVPGDARVTTLGRFLRRSSLDELPQLLNVVRGEMSLVGPRPHAPATMVAGQSFEEAAKFYRLRYRAKPGMTGLAQIRGQRGATGDVSALEQRVTSDLEYIETWSLWLDCLILLRTVPAVLRARNAY